MSRGSNQKFKFTYLMRIMLENTDDEHALTMSQIMDELEKYDVTADYGKGFRWRINIIFFGRFCR